MKFNTLVFVLNIALANALTTSPVLCSNSNDCGTGTHVICSATSLPPHCACNLDCMTYANRSCTINNCFMIENGECKKEGVPFLTGILTTVFVWYTGAPFFVAGTGLAIGLGVLSILGCCCSCIGKGLMKSKEETSCIGVIMAIFGSLAMLSTFIVALIYYIDPFDKLPNGCYAVQGPP